MSYHSLAASRSQFCSSGNTCGSSTDPKKQFCLTPSQTCPLNGLRVESSAMNYSSPTTTSSLQGGWTAYEIRNNQSNSPISKLWLAVGRPCGNLGEDYLQRPYYVSPVLSADNGDCIYTNADGSHEHTLFWATNFTDSELDVYNENSLITAIRNHVPDYVES